MVPFLLFPCKENCRILKKKEKKKRNSERKKVYKKQMRKNTTKVWKQQKKPFYHLTPLSLTLTPPPFRGVRFRPVLESIGLGSVARSEVSFTTFIIDMIDSALIWTMHVLAGRRYCTVQITFFKESVPRDFQSSFLSWIDSSREVKHCVSLKGQSINQI